MLYATLPESSGVHVGYIMSPVVVLSRYEGGANPGAYRPFWTGIPAGVSVELRQFRLAIADIFVKIAPFQEGGHKVCTASLYK